MPTRTAALLAAGALASAQDPTSLLDVQGIRSAMAAAQAQQPAPDATPKAAPVLKVDAEAQARQKAEQDRREQEIAAAKARERGPRRFAADLFDTRMAAPGGTEGGVAEDYVLGTGDTLQLYAFGSATFEVPLQVDGRGEVVVPRVGSVKVGGLDLARARRAVQAKVAQNFSKATVDLTVVKLREVRVFVLGEVYKPGAYLVPSLSSLVNVLGLAGGPTAVGTLRRIQVLRGGREVHSLDLYPLRAEGRGNLNLYFQNGDTVFVGLAAEPVTLEGAFVRVVGAAGDLSPREQRREDEEKGRLERQIRQLEAGLEVKALPGRGEDGASLQMFDPAKRAEIEDRIGALRAQLKRLGEVRRGDQRSRGPREEDGPEQPGWLAKWQAEGRAPSLQFELLSGETAADALRFAGGFALQAFGDSLTLRRLDGQGVLDARDLPQAELARTPLRRGDILSALPRRDRLERMVTVQGWVRVPGAFARGEGLKVGALLNRERQVLPDTYLGRGEIVRTLPDGNTRYLAFDVARALKGDPAHDLALENRDRIELYRTEDLRIPRTVEVLGPFTKPGLFDFHEGMRAADLIFRAGAPRLNAERHVAELARMQDGRRSEVLRLDLGRLLSTEAGSPVDLKDDAVNPPLRPYDQLSVYSRPDYRTHRVVTLGGQVVRPGSYALDGPRTGLRELLARAGGLTPEAQAKGAVFLRRMSEVDPDKARAALESGLSSQDPTGQGINEILGRLNETVRQPTTGLLLKNPLLHALQTGAVNRLVVNLPAILAGDPKSEVELQDGDEIIVPRRTDAAYVVGETASPFAAYKVEPGLKAKELLRLAGGTTRNADGGNLRLLKADGRILDSGVLAQEVEPGDALLVPQRIRRDVTWQESLAALTPIAILISALRR